MNKKALEYITYEDLYKKEEESIISEDNRIYLEIPDYREEDLRENKKIKKENKRVIIIEI